MKKIRVMTIVGTRPEIIRLSETIKKLDIFFDHTLVHTGQNWDFRLNDIFFSEFDLRKPDYYLDAVGENLGETMGNIISKSFEILNEQKPDALLILGDTNSALSAVSAKRLKIPIFHMEAGNRCFDQNLPEEINRKIVDHISDINLAYTEHARRNLISEGVRKDHIFVTGSPITEVLNLNQIQINKSKILEKLDLQEGGYILLSAHREENIDNENNFYSIMNSINYLAEKYGKPIIFSTHPRCKKFIEIRKFVFHPLVRLLDPFGYFDYNQLQLNAFCVLSDSGTLPEESAILGFPAVSIRTSTERPEAMDQGNVVIGGITIDTIIQSVEMARRLKDIEVRKSKVLDYQDVDVSLKVARIILSYTSIVNDVIWRKK